MSATMRVSENRSVSKATLVTLLRRNAALIQGVFALLWGVRFAALTGAWEVPAVVAIASFVATRRAFVATTPLRARDEFRTSQGRAFLRPVTVVTVVQIVASIVLPMFGTVLGRDDLVVPIVAFTIGVFLVFFATPLELPTVRWIGLAYTMAALGLPLLVTDELLADWVSAVSAVALLASAWCCAAATRS